MCLSRTRPLREDARDAAIQLRALRVTGVRADHDIPGERLLLQHILQIYMLAIDRSDLYSSPGRSGPASPWCWRRSYRPACAYFPRRFCPPRAWKRKQSVRDIPGNQVVVVCVRVRVRVGGGGGEGMEMMAQHLSCSGGLLVFLPPALLVPAGDRVCAHKQSVRRRPRECAGNCCVFHSKWPLSPPPFPPRSPPKGAFGEISARKERAFNVKLAVLCSHKARLRLWSRPRA